MPHVMKYAEEVSIRVNLFLTTYFCNLFSSDVTVMSQDKQQEHIFVRGTEKLIPTGNTERKRNNFSIERLES